MINTNGLYWETYADQSNEDGFKYIGVGNDITEITDIDEQVAEFQRRYGAKSEIKLYKET